MKPDDQVLRGFEIHFMPLKVSPVLYVTGIIGFHGIPEIVLTGYNKMCGIQLHCDIFPDEIGIL
jgi:hypothetical protein